MRRPKKEDDSGVILNAAVSTAIKGYGSFDVEKFKEAKNLNKNAKFKEQEWLPLSEAFNDAITLPGLALGHINIIRGHSDTGKSTALMEAAIAVQKSGTKLPVFIITEMKFSMDRAIEMGFEAEKITDDETGDVSYKGNFIYVDKDQLTTIEDIAAFVSDILNEQKKGNIPMDIVFLVDSFGSVPCQQSFDSGKNNNMWNASAMATQFGNFINQRIMMSRKASSVYTNTMIAVNKIRVEVPMGGNIYEKPKMKNKAGDALYWDASLVITFGNITNSGTAKIKATKNKKEVEFARRVKISVDKNHITHLTTTSKIIMTPYGFIDDKPSTLNNYKKEHSQEWVSILGGADFDVIEEEMKDEDIRDVRDMLGSDDE